MERYGRLDSGDVIFVQRAPHSIDRIDPCSADGDYFRNQRIVIWRHAVARINVRVDSNNAAAWRIIKIDPPRPRLECFGWIFGIDTALDRVQPRFRTRDVRRKRLARGDPDLLFDEVASIKLLRDGGLHLDAPGQFP